jgi:hypothetical protein
MTAAQLTACRENAQLSTGPRTIAGKKRSSLNAFRHGLTGQIVIHTPEDQEAFQKKALRWHPRSFGPRRRSRVRSCPSHRGGPLAPQPRPRAGKLDLRPRPKPKQKKKLCCWSNSHKPKAETTTPPTISRPNPSLLASFFPGPPSSVKLSAAASLAPCAPYEERPGERNLAPYRNLVMK